MSPCPTNLHQTRNPSQVGQLKAVGRQPGANDRLQGEQLIKHQSDLRHHQALTSWLKPSDSKQNPIRQTGGLWFVTAQVTHSPGILESSGVFFFFFLLAHCGNEPNGEQS